MRILHVIENLNTGGAEHMLVNLAIEQLRRNHQVAVLCLFERGVLADRLTSLGIEVHACHKKRGLTIAFLRQIMGVMTGFSPDVIHAHSLMGNYYMAFFRLFAAPRARQIVTRHGLLRTGHVKRLNQLFNLSLWLTQWAVGVCDPVTEELIAHHSGFKTKILTIHNGIDLSRFMPRNPQSQTALKAELNLPESYHLIGIVARLESVKNHRLLLTAFQMVNKSQPNTALVIIGDGSLRQELEAYTQSLNLTPAVFFLGDRTDVHELLAGLDVYALSSNSEGYSLSLVEAAAASLPLVATDVGGNANIVKPGQNGSLVPANDPTALAEALIRLVQDPRQASLMGRNSRTWAEQYGSLASMADAYQQLYEQPT